MIGLIVLLGLLIWIILGIFFFGFAMKLFIVFFAVLLSVRIYSYIKNKN